MRAPREAPRFSDELRKKTFTGRVKIERVETKKWFRTVESYRYMLEFDVVYDRIFYTGCLGPNRTVTATEWYEATYKDYLKNIEDRTFMLDSE